jgi:hypothetical protein
MPDIVPLSKVARHQLAKYLESLGNPRETTEWKYFDGRFNDDLERGFAVVADDEVVGFIGFIPFNLSVRGKVERAYWACDWSVSAQLRGTYGLWLLDAALEHCGVLIAFGGAEVTQKIMRRIATKIDIAAGVVFQRRLSLERYVGWLAHRGVAPPSLVNSRVGRIRVPTLRSRRRIQTTVTLTHGLPDGGFALPLDDSVNQATPLFDRAALEWRLARSPDVDAWTASAPGQSAVVLFWRSAHAGRDWKLALFCEPKFDGALHDCLEVANRKMTSLQAAVALVLTSRSNEKIISVLNSAGYAKSKIVYPLQIMDTYNILNVETMSGLTYLDSDIFHRF